MVDKLAALGTREVSLIGGEAYLRRDWTEIVRAIRSHGINCSIQTGGRNLNAHRIAEAVEAGLQGVGVSIDGLEPLHDRLRGVPGSFRQALLALTDCREAGLQTSVNTQIGAETIPDLPGLMDRIIDVGVKHWQIQLTVAMGNAVDHDALLLQPYQLLDLMPTLARLYHEGVTRGLLMMPGNNIGYFGEYEHLWRGHNDDRGHWTGCTAGQSVIGLEADGTVKGCPSLPTVGYAGGNVRDLPLETIWRKRADPLRPVAVRRPLGLLRLVLLRRCLPGRMHLDGPLAVRATWEQPLLSLPRPPARRTRPARAGRQDPRGPGHLLRRRILRIGRRTDPLSPADVDGVPPSCACRRPAHPGVVGGQPRRPGPDSAEARTVPRLRLFRLGGRDDLPALRRRHP